MGLRGDITWPVAVTEGSRLSRESVFLRWNCWYIRFIFKITFMLHYLEEAHQTVNITSFISPPPPFLSPLCPGGNIVCHLNRLWKLRWIPCTVKNRSKLFLKTLYVRITPPRYYYCCFSWFQVHYFPIFLNILITAGGFALQLTRFLSALICEKLKGNKWIRANPKIKFRCSFKVKSEYHLSVVATILSFTTGTWWKSSDTNVAQSWESSNKQFYI